MPLILPGLGVVKSVNVITLTLLRVWPVAAGAYLILLAFRIAGGDRAISIVLYAPLVPAFLIGICTAPIRSGGRD